MAPSGAQPSTFCPRYWASTFNSGRHTSAKCSATPRSSRISSASRLRNSNGSSSNTQLHKQHPISSSGGSARRSRSRQSMPNWWTASARFRPSSTSGWACRSSASQLRYWQSTTSAPARCTREMAIDGYLASLQAISNKILAKRTSRMEVAMRSPPLAARMPPTYLDRWRGKLKLRAGPERARPQSGFSRPQLLVFSSRRN